MDRVHLVACAAVAEREFAYVRPSVILPGRDDVQLFAGTCRVVSAIDCVVFWMKRERERLAETAGEHSLIGNRIIGEGISGRRSAVAWIDTEQLADRFDRVGEPLTGCAEDIIVSDARI